MMNTILLKIQDIELFREVISKYRNSYLNKETFKYKILEDSLVELIYPSLNELYELGSYYGNNLFYKYNKIELGERYIKIDKCVFEGENTCDSWGRIVDIELLNEKFIKFRLINLSWADSSQFYRPFKLMSEENIKTIERIVGINSSDYTNISHPISYQIIEDNLIFFRTEYPSKIFLDSIFEIKWKIRTTLLG